DDADAITLARFRAADLRVETKSDLTPVSEADRAVEAMLRGRIERERPGEPVLGEEEGGADTSGWILDPIDGTRNYTRGIPVWATLIAFADRVAVVSAPALGRRWWAVRGGGAYVNGESIHVSRISRLEDATLLYALDRPVPERAWAAWHLRGFGDFWAHMLVAEGAAELAVDAPDLAVWDAAPLSIILEEAGGRYESSVSSNGVLDLSGLR
ncbi:MAG TPA: inositol monophosphatase family protein, partial [Gaiellaceae bacterium]|nr:inositol monophosphatase family protein [Gaiellaceae bacterium]